MRKLVGLIQDRPLVVTLSAFGLVLLHLALACLGIISNPWQALQDAADSGIAIYLGAASAAAIVAGFAGVVVVFGLTANSSRFRELRLKSGESLNKNWTSASVSGFAAAGLSLFAAILAGLQFQAASPWIFEWSILLLVHGTLRIIWLLRSLMKVVASDDAAADRQSKTRSYTKDSFK
jgi:hypothetical protein